MLFFCRFDYKYNQLDDSQRSENDTTQTIERIEVIDYIVKAEETQRVGKNKAQKHDGVSMLIVGKHCKFLCARHSFLHSVTDDF